MFIIYRKVNIYFEFLSLTMNIFFEMQINLTGYKYLEISA